MATQVHYSFRSASVSIFNRSLFIIIGGEIEMSKEIDEFYKQYSARIMELDDTPLFASGTFGTFKILSVEEYEKMQKQIETLEKQLADSEAKLTGLQQENKVLKDIRTLERVVPRNAQINKLSNRDCYLKGFENALSETVRTFEEAYGKEKCKLVEERDKYLTDIVKVGGYEYQIEDLKQQLAEKDEIFHYAKLEWEDCLHKTCEEHSVFIKKLSQQLAEKDEKQKRTNKVVEQFQQRVKYFSEKDQDKISFAVEQLEKVREYADIDYRKHCYIDAVQLDKYIDNQIKQLKASPLEDKEGK